MWWLLACAAAPASGAWVPWSGLGPTCAVELAGPGLPAFTWAPCGPGCERLGLPEGVRLDREPEFTPGGLLALTLTAADHQDHVVLDPTGAVHAALRRPVAWDEGCWLLSADLDEREWLFRARLADGAGSVRDAPAERIVRVDLIGGGARLDPWRDESASTWAPRLGHDGVDWMFEAPNRRVWRLADGALSLAWAPASSGDGIVGPVARGPDGVVTSLRQAGVTRVWSLDAEGTTRWPGGDEQVDVGSDGHDVVWSSRGADGWAVWTAPWGAPGEARRVAADGTTLRPAPWVVGEGLAAHLGVASGTLDVVGLGDGATTTVAPPKGTTALTPLGIAGGRLYTRGWGGGGAILRFEVGGADGG